MWSNGAFHIFRFFFFFAYINCAVVLWISLLSTLRKNWFNNSHESTHLLLSTLLHWLSCCIQICSFNIAGQGNHERKAVDIHISGSSRYDPDQVQNTVYVWMKALENQIFFLRAELTGAWTLYWTSMSQVALSVIFLSIFTPLYDAVYITAEIRMF